MAVTPADLVAAFPEWTQVNTDYPDVVTTAIAFGTTDINEETAGGQYELMIMLAASSFLYDHEYGRDLKKQNDSSANPYERRLVKMKKLKGSAQRTLWTEGDFSGDV